MKTSIVVKYSSLCRNLFECNFRNDSINFICLEINSTFKKTIKIRANQHFKFKICSNEALKYLNNLNLKIEIYSSDQCDKNTNG